MPRTSENKPKCLPERLKNTRCLLEGIEPTNENFYGHFGKGCQQSTSRTVEGVTLPVPSCQAKHDEVFHRLRYTDLFNAFFHNDGENVTTILDEETLFGRPNPWTFCGTFDHSEISSGDDLPIPLFYNEKKYEAKPEAIECFMMTHEFLLAVLEALIEQNELTYTNFVKDKSMEATHYLANSVDVVKAIADVLQGKDADAFLYGGETYDMVLLKSVIDEEEGAEGEEESDEKEEEESDEEEGEESDEETHVTPVANLTLGVFSVHKNFIVACDKTLAQLGAATSQHPTGWSATSVGSTFTTLRTIGQPIHELALYRFPGNNGQHYVLRESSSSAGHSTYKWIQLNDGSSSEEESSSDEESSSEEEESSSSEEFHVGDRGTLNINLTEEEKKANVGYLGRPQNAVYEVVNVNRDANLCVKLVSDDKNTMTHNIPRRYFNKLVEQNSTVIDLTEDDDDKDAEHSQHAARIQALWRGYTARKQANKKIRAFVRIQALWRGRVARRSVATKRNSHEPLKKKRKKRAKPTYVPPTCLDEVPVYSKKKFAWKDGYMAKQKQKNGGFRYCVKDGSSWAYFENDEEALNYIQSA